MTDSPDGYWLPAGFSQREIAAALKTYRWDSDISREQMAYELGLEQKAYYRIENGRDPITPPRRLWMALHVLKIPMDTFIAELERRRGEGRKQSSNVNDVL